MEEIANGASAGKHTQFLDLTNGAGGETSQDDDSMSSPQQRPVAAPTKSVVGNTGRLKLDPNTPGRVVESGQEQTGRWTKEEHEAFLSALQMYGKEWKKVAAKVKTRTVVQTRTHAQKYFQKLAKVVESGKDHVTHVDMGIAADSRKTTPKQPKKPRLNASTAKAQRQGSLTSAAQVISNLSGAEAPVAFQLPASSLPSTSFGNPKPISTMNGLTQPAIVSTHGYNSFNAPSVGVKESFSNGMNYGGPKPATSSFAIKITDDVAMKRGRFPEPSPAASGKRKLAEIAAARMLAGVAAVQGKPMLAPMSEDGAATPPPTDDTKMQVPAPVSVKSGDTEQPRKPAGLSLQIVNPESLGVSYEEQKRRRGGDSPQTPWEGDMKALMSEEKKKPPLGVPESLQMPQAPVMGVFAATSSLHPICGPGGAYGRSPLHKAVCEMDLAVVQSELTSRAQDFQKQDDKGYCAMHSACALCMTDLQNSSIATDLVRALIAAGADASVCDEEGNTPLHWAARAGDVGTAELLLLRNCPKDAKNERGETALHWAMRAGRVGMSVVSILLENGAKPSVWNKEFKRPLDIAADGFFDEGENSVIELKKIAAARKRLSKEQRHVLKEAAEQRKRAREHLLRLSVQSRTLVLNHPECLEHHPKSSSDWEAPGRVTSIMEKILGTDPKMQAIHSHEITVSQDFDRASLDLLRRIHSADYLSFVNDLSKELEKKQREENDADASRSAPTVVPFTPMVQRSIIKVTESNVKQHSDTSFSVGSLRAARRAAGAVQHAVDCVLIGRTRNAFCVVRPPGHHAGINGLLDGGESCGFCIFNSVAAGAMHAISDERLLCERCAIVDIDAHHGNGTEEIVRKYHDPSKLFFFSIHLYDNDEKKRKRESKSFQYKFYPGTGDEDDIALNIINVPITPLWKEKQANPTASHSTRTRTRTKRYSDDGDSSENGTPKASDVETENSRGSGSVPSTPTSAVPNSNSGRHAYRKAIQNRLLPALRAFNPDLILISTGFDACKGDVGNAKHEFGGKEKMGIDLEPEDYAWTTRKILEIADICCQGRVVSILEGGYGRTPAATAGVPNDGSNSLDKSVFSECAMRHVHAMIDPYDVEKRFKSSKSDP
eukprot:CAMPEP_0113658460 /NCGR_PEP_ID=MMETSP0017_2-20120614/31730_1 /TAXON_ID=2856 /ORGANISM="Cylindrotheca closterium" /LENGTH=1113 /DNA_ID=CAMNT_0000572733 /DNA_START=65 /DNA_END=3407 /DNA_ORIENTATION=- /assembly_acc=CAM_ASM_000147